MGGPLEDPRPWGPCSQAMAAITREEVFRIAVAIANIRETCHHQSFDLHRDYFDEIGMVHAHQIDLTKS